MNDLSRALKHSTTSIFADDTNLCYKSKDLSPLNEVLNEDLSHLKKKVKALLTPIAHRAVLGYITAQSCV